MLNDQRVFFSDNGVLTDYTRHLNDFRSANFAMTYVAGEDYLYVGSDYPFNNQYFDISVSNAVGSIASVSLWSGQGSGWKPALDVIDFTSTAGASLNVGGHITWKRDRDEAWVRQDKSTEVTGLETSPVIYGLYWVRIAWTVGITSTIDYIGNKFSNDDQLYSLYPDMNNQSMRDQWEQGAVSGTKASWDEQCFVAAQAIITDLKSGNILVSDSQLMDFEIFTLPSIHKTAEIIYRGMGKAYAEDRISARDSYKEAIDLKNMRVDRSGDGNLSRAEKSSSLTFMGR